MKVFLKLMVVVAVLGAAMFFFTPTPEAGACPQLFCAA